MKREGIKLKCRVRNMTIQGLLACSSIAFLCVRSLALQPPRSEPAKVTIVVERVERVNSNIAHFWLKVRNGSTRPVFFEGYPFDMQQMEGLYLEQWQAQEGWRIVVPCRDLFASDAIKLKPGEAITQEPVLELPLSSVCKRRDIHFEGKFRFRVDYFKTDSAVRTYIKHMNSLGHGPPPPAFAVSEPFEIPPLKK